MGEADPNGVQTNHSQDTATAAASSPVPSLNRTLQSHPTSRGRRPRALGSRSRLADQYGPVSDDSQSPDAAAANEAAGGHFESEDSPSTALAEKPVTVRTAQKRKRQHQQQQESIPAAVTTAAVQLTRSTDADAMTELSRSSEAGTPVGTQQRRDQAAKPETALRQQQQQQSEQELDSEQTGSLRRTGRQRKLTPAAAAAAEEFPSLYRNTPKAPPPTAAKAKAVRNRSPAESDQDWHEDEETAAAATTPRRGQSKQTHAAAGAGVSHVQMSQLVRCGILPAGTHELFFKGQPCEVQVLSDGMQWLPLYRIRLPPRPQYNYIGDRLNESPFLQLLYVCLVFSRYAALSWQSAT